MVNLRNTAGQEYFKSWVELENKKEKMFQQGKVNEWEIDFAQVKLTPAEVSGNKKVAKMLMLPTQTMCLKNMQKVFGYMNTQMLEQSEYLGTKRAKRYVKAIFDLSNEHIDLYSDVKSC